MFYSKQLLLILLGVVCSCQPYFFFIFWSTSLLFRLILKDSSGSTSRERRVSISQRSNNILIPLAWRWWLCLSPVSDLRVHIWWRLSYDNDDHDHDHNDTHLLLPFAIAPPLHPHSKTWNQKPNTQKDNKHFSCFYFVSSFEVCHTAF